MEKDHLATCGAYCGSCPYHIKERTPYCSGCGAHKGHPFWGECKLYTCAKNHKAEHCGLCSEFPCELFVNQYDPEHGQQSAFTRAGFLAYRKKAGNDKYVKMFQKVEKEHK